MSFTALGSLGTAAVSNTSRDAPVAVSRDVPVGNLIVVWFSTMNIFDVGDPTDGYNWPRCEDDKGNVYGQIGSATNTDSFFGTGAAIWIFVTTVTTALDSGDLITPYVGNHAPGSPVARAASVEEFTIGTGKRWAISSTRYTSWAQNGDNEPSSGSYTMPGSTRECLFLHGLGWRGPITDTFTWDSNWIEITAAGTNVGFPPPNQTVRGGYRIESASSVTVDVTSDSNDRPVAQTMNALCEVPIGRPFPEAPILDDFNRADESPLDNGTWSTTEFALGFAPLDLVSNEATGNGGSQWLESHTNCVETYITITDFDLSVLHFFVSGASEDATFVGRGAEWANPSSQGWTVRQGQSAIFGNVTGLIHLYPTVAGVAPPEPSKLGLRRSRAVDGGAGVDELWVELGGGWQEISAMFVQVGGTFPTSGRYAIGVVGSGKLDDFGGGEVPCVLGRPQIMRYR